jgi:type IV pilus assembly protein PilA
MISTLRQRLRNDEGGFTLIELLVVIIIIGILLAIAIPSYLGFRDRAQKSAAQSNIRAIVPAVEAYYSDQGTYATMTLALLKSGYDQSIDTANYTLANLAAGDYCVSTVEGNYTAWKRAPSGTVQVKLTTDAAPAVCAAG